MANMMGFGGFGTTKASITAHHHRFSRIDGSQGKTTGQYEGSTSNVHTQRTWRQYMNRRGGFNRPLEKVPTKKK